MTDRTDKPGFVRRLESFSKTCSTPVIRSRPIAGLTVHSRGADCSHEISNTKKEIGRSMANRSLDYCTGRPHHGHHAAVIVFFLESTGTAGRSRTAVTRPQCLAN